jgi:hypothetical protein
MFEDRGMTDPKGAIYTVGRRFLLCQGPPLTAFTEGKSDAGWAAGSPGAEKAAPRYDGS